MGKNLAGTTITAYSGSSPQETVHVNGFCRTEISSCTGSQRPHCQVEGCIANMSSAKHYHRRHKVCEFHSKASTVVVGGHIQRFCQQCSRCEFDEKKRSCRKSLADHNRRRRKPQPSPFTASQCQAGTAALENGKQETGITSSHDATGLQIIPNINTSISTAPFWIASVTPQSSVPMMISPKTYKGHIPVLQGASNDKTRCVDYLYANIEQTGANLSREKRILSDRQIDSREYQLVHPCSLNCGLLSSEITGHIAWPAPKDIQYSQSLISVNNSHSNVHVIETSKSSLNRRIFSSSNYNPVALSSMKNGGSNWILNGSSAEGSQI